MEKSGESNWSIGSIVGTRHTAVPRNGRRDNVGGIMTMNQPSSYSADDDSEPALLLFCRFTHCTKLPWALLPVFLFSAVQ